MSYTDVVSTLSNVENPTSDFVSFSWSDQRYFNVDPQRWNSVEISGVEMLAGKIPNEIILLCMDYEASFSLEKDESWKK